MNDDEAIALISIEGIRADGRHGANPGEQLELQEFIVDIDVAVERRGDTLEETADYRQVVSTVRRTVESTSFVLLEALAGAVADEVRTLPAVEAVTVVVHKPAAAISMGVDDVSAEVTLESE